MLDGDNTIFGNSHRHFVPPRSLGKTSKEGDLIYSLEMNKLQENASHFLELGRWVGDLPNEPNWPDSLKCFAFLEETKVMGIDWRKFYFGKIYFCNN
jgi:hypothetical protein